MTRNILICLSFAEFTIKLRAGESIQFKSFVSTSPTDLVWRKVHVTANYDITAQKTSLDQPSEA
jgi:hypothetical protein